jgi:hypothetical protein
MRTRVRERGLRLAAALASTAWLAACVDTQEQLRTLEEYGGISAAPSNGAPDYDYTVIIRNLRQVGVDPTLKADRERLSSAFLGSRCPNHRVVGETELATSNPMLDRSRSKDYAVRVKC